jgi:HEAT repeat protein
MDARSDAGGAKGASASERAILALVSALASEDVGVRERARFALVEKGREAVPALINALTHPKNQARWEAAKALAEIADPAAALPLVHTLEDEDAGIRWVAAEGLIAMERGALPPVLRALIDRPHSLWLREGAHHVLHELVGGPLGERLAPVLEALEHGNPEEVVPVAAASALAGLSGGVR